MNVKMQFSLGRAVVSFFLIGLIVMPVAAQDFQNISSTAEVIVSEPHVDGEVLVKFKERKIDMDQVSGRASLNSFVYAEGLKKEDTIAPQNVTLLSSKSDESTEQLIDRLQDDSRVEYVVPNYLRKVFDTEPSQYIPNDSFFADQWSLHNALDKDIDAPEAWNIFKGNSSVIVGVLDTGADLTHPDLVGNLWNGSIEASGCKDDNGVVIEAGCPNHGWNYVTDIDPTNDADPTDDHGHGTHVASIVGARGDDELGMAGVSMHVTLMPIKVADKDGFLSSSDWIKGLNFAKQNGAKIVNASFGGFEYSQAEYDAIHDFPGLFIAAAGNSGSDNDVITTPNYPSNYNLDTIIAVAATDASDALADFSNYGVTSVDVGAPGVDIWGAIPGGDYMESKGTSMAAPHVAGLAALIWGYDTALTATQVRDDILATGDIDPQLSGKVSTGMRINAYNALKGLTTVPTIVSAVVGDDGVSGNGKLSVNFMLKDVIGGLPVTLKQFEYSVDGGVTFVAPTSGDISAALSVSPTNLLDMAEATWSANSYVTSAVTSLIPPTEYSFFVDLNSTDLALLTTPIQPDVRVRFLANNGIVDSDVAVSNDVIPSVATLTGAPSSVEFTKEKTAAITVAGDGVVSYAYKLDSAVLTDFVDVSTSLALSDVADGTHILSVYGKDVNGNVQRSPTVATWSVDATAPVGTIAVTTVSPMKTKTPELALTVSDAGVGVTGAKVQLSCNGIHFSDPIDFAETITTFDVQSGINACIQSDGDKNVFAQFQDSLGNIGPVVQTELFTVFAGPVVAQILTKPSAISAPAVTFTIGGTFVTAYKYRLDAVSGTEDFSPETPVSAPLVLSGASALSDGAHKIEFMAKDDVGNFQSAETATVYSWTVDATPPVFSLSGTPASETTSTSAVITIVSNDAVAYKFALDSGSFSTERSFSNTISLDSLVVGSHTVKVIARDTLGNYTSETSAISTTWTIVAPPPPPPPPAPVFVPAPVVSTPAAAAPVIAVPVFTPVVPAPPPQTGIVLGVSTVNLVNGMVLQLEGRGLYYVIENGKRRPIPYSTYRKKYFKTSRAIKLSSALLKKIPQYRAGK